MSARCWACSDCTEPGGHATPHTCDCDEKWLPSPAISTHRRCPNDPPQCDHSATFHDGFDGAWNCCVAGCKCDARPTTNVIPFRWRA